MFHFLAVMSVKSKGTLHFSASWSVKNNARFFYKVTFNCRRGPLLHESQNSPGNSTLSTASSLGEKGVQGKGKRRGLGVGRGTLVSGIFADWGGMNNARGASGRHPGHPPSPPVHHNWKLTMQTRPLLPRPGGGGGGGYIPQTTIHSYHI